MPTPLGFLNVHLTVTCPICGAVGERDVPFSPDGVITGAWDCMCSHVQNWVDWWGDEEEEEDAPSWLGQRKSAEERSGVARGAVSVTEAARALAVCTRTLKRWQQAGRLGPDEMWQGPTGHWFLSRGAVHSLGGKLN